MSAEDVFPPTTEAITVRIGLRTNPYSLPHPDHGTISAADVDDYRTGLYRSGP